eukprot:1985401-Rhodomonas_salina.1
MDENDDPQKPASVKHMAPGNLPLYSHSPAMPCRRPILTQRMTRIGRSGRPILGWTVRVYCT